MDSVIKFYTIFLSLIENTLVFSGITVITFSYISGNTTFSIFLSNNVYERGE